MLAQLQTNMSWASVAILGVEKGNGTTLTQNHNITDVHISPVSKFVLIAIM